MILSIFHVLIGRLYVICRKNVYLSPLFLIGLFVFLVLSSKHSLDILDTRPYLIYNLQMFSSFP